MAKKRKAGSTFGHIADEIRQHGRVSGFETFRDYVLENWDNLKGEINPYSAIKLALEIDRHALFSEVAELRKQGDKAAELSGELQDYLRGKIDMAPDSTGERAEIAPPAPPSMYSDLDELISPAQLDDEEEDE